MTDYTKLVEALRILQDKNSLSYYKRQVCKDAADAIEALEARLGEAENSVERWKDMYLTKHEPKRGEWKRDEKRWGENSIRCSLCGAVIEDEEWGWRNWNYCYHCGAKMEVQE